ncbi:MAG: hypothetical protein ACKON7_01560, partial [Planctomycetaceae bacterium]
MSVAHDERRADALDEPPALSPAACVVLVRTVLDPETTAGGLAASFRLHGGDDAAVSGWLAAAERACAAVAAARAAVVERLAAGFSVAGVPPAARRPRPGPAPRPHRPAPPPRGLRAPPRHRPQAADTMPPARRR